MLMKRNPTYFLLLAAIGLMVSCQPAATSAAPATATATAIPEADPTATPAAPTPEQPVACPALQADALADLETIRGELTLLRGLTPLGEVALERIDADEFEAQRHAALDAYLEQGNLNTDLLTMVLFDVLDETFDLEGFYREVNTTELALEYQPQSESIVAACDQALDPAGQFAYAYAFSLALLDQHFDLEESLAALDTNCMLHPEQCRAMMSLIQGDAALLQSQWLRIYATEDMEELAAFQAQSDNPALSQAPAFLRVNLLFPTLEGFNFVHVHYLEGGWAAVDALYASPPQSTEQILHPERYPYDTPVQLHLPDLAAAMGSAWSVHDPVPLGELQLRSVLDSRLPSSEAMEAAEGWGGDSFIVIEQQESGALGAASISQWDSVADAHEFYYALRDYGTLRFGEPTRTETGLVQWASTDTVALARLVSNQVLFLMAPDADTLLALDASFALPVVAQP